MRRVAIGMLALGAMILAGTCEGQTAASYASDEQKVIIPTAVAFSINDIEVPAQVKGFIDSVVFEEGAYVETGTHIYRIADLSHLQWVMVG